MALKAIIAISAFRSSFAGCLSKWKILFAAAIVLIYDHNMKKDDSRFSLLCVDDDPHVLSSLKRLFFDEDYRIHTAGDGESALDLLKQTRIDAALIDLKMPGMDGLTLLEKVCAAYPHVQAVILTGHGGVREAVKAIQMGAKDFLEKPFSPEGLRARVGQLCEIWQLKKENQRLKEKVEFTFGYEQLVGNSTPILKLKERILRVAPDDAAVLIAGETGSGKELVARALHHHSPRREHPFVPVDCGAISESVMESELFGHVKGAFTGAHMTTMGLIRSSHRGTLFLDEVGELPQPMQVKLLRTIQEKEVRPVGGTTSHRVDMRLIAATNRDLDQAIHEGRFRQDLLYRLNVVILNIPPLREHREDIPLLAEHFLRRLRSSISPVGAVAPEALDMMAGYDWPGNIRELENVIRRAIALGKSTRIEPDSLPEHMKMPSGDNTGTPGLPQNHSLAAYEKAAIQNALQKTQGNRREAALLLQISEATLYRKIKHYRLSL
ncbi:MAG: sigma-54 dependent transcriptional regulator [Deltaproteobacteria bacterium]|nr:sigma-54 dependent transcriptional regulator [Deltaproteobacteria bacterium]MCF8118732.1 sigma-54 dependent transcriptional regulator [Deltaproteobacteria bacterium]